MEPTTIAIIIAVVVIVMYASELIPMSVTAVLSCISMGVLGIAMWPRVYSGFSNDITMMTAGMIVVGDTLFETGAAQWIGGKIVRMFGRTEKMFIAASICITAFLSAFLSNSATAAMMFPVMAAAIATSKGVLTKRNTYMAVGFASIAGGGLTLIGSTPQLLAQGILQEGGFRTIGFFDYAWAGLPKVFILLVYFLTIGYALGKKFYDFPEPIDPAQEEGSHAADGSFTPKMLTSLLIMAGCVAAFVTSLWTLGTVAMLGACLCVVTRCINAKKLYRNLDWSTIILVSGSIGFANCLADSGAGTVIANYVVGLLGEGVSPLMMMSALGLLAVILGNIMTHTATAAILLPITIYIAQGLNMDVSDACMIIVIFTNVTYSTPIMTPAATLSLAAGYRFKDFVKVGGLLNVISYFSVVAMLPLLFDL